MNSSILKKVIEELGNETPRLDYVRGMLETLYEIETIPAFETYPSLHETAIKVSNKVGVPARINGEPNDEAAILDARARAAIESVKAMADASTIE